MSLQQRMNELTSLQQRMTEFQKTTDIEFARLALRTDDVRQTCEAFAWAQLQGNRAEQNRLRPRMAEIHELELRAYPPADEAPTASDADAGFARTLERVVGFPLQKQEYAAMVHPPLNSPHSRDATADAGDSFAKALEKEFKDY